MEQPYCMYVKHDCLSACLAVSTLVNARLGKKLSTNNREVRQLKECRMSFKAKVFVVCSSGPRKAVASGCRSPVIPILKWGEFILFARVKNVLCK